MKVLYTWLAGHLAGRFVFNDSTAVEFEYAANAPETPVSLSLPRHGGWARKSPWRFLDNLLPDSDETRHAIAQAVHAPSDDVYGLLSIIGSDVAGGLVFSPTENYPTPPNHWAKLARRSGLDEDKVVSVAQHVANTVILHADEAFTDLPPHVRDHLRYALTHSNQHMTTDRQQWDVAIPDKGRLVVQSAEERVEDKHHMLPPTPPNNGVCGNMFATDESCKTT